MDGYGIPTTSNPTGTITTIKGGLQCNFINSYNVLNVSFPYITQNSLMDA